MKRSFLAGFGGVGLLFLAATTGAACGGSSTDGSVLDPDAGGSTTGACADQVKNNSETDVDCGGSTCQKCALGKACAGPADCVSGTCTGGVCAGEVTTAAPKITSFTPEKAKITAGTATKLTAVFTGGTGTIDKSVGAVTSGTAVSTGNIAAATTFTLTVTNAAGQKVTQTTTVDVAVAPVITGFIATDPKVSRGAGTTLTATFTGGTGEVDNGIGAVTSGNGVPSGNLVAKKTFKLTVTNELGDTATQNAEVDVKKELVISNYGSNSLVVVDDDATGAVTPKRTLSGGTTTLSQPRGVFVVGDEIYVANQNQQAISVFNLMDEGNVAPKRQLKGGTTTLATPTGVFVVGGELFVGDQSSGYKVWNATDTGDVAPKRTVSGAAAGISTGTYAIVDNGEVYVASFGSGNIKVFPVAASGDVAPTRTIAVTGGSPIGLYINGDEVFSGQGTASGIAINNKTTGNALRRITGGSTTLYFGEQCTVIGDELLCANYGSNSVLVFPRTGDGNIAPARSISTGASGPLGLFHY